MLDLMTLGPGPMVSPGVEEGNHLSEGRGPRAKWAEETLSPDGPHRHHLNPAPQETRRDPSRKWLQFLEDSRLHACQSLRRTWGSEGLESCHATLFSTPVSLSVAMEGRPF